jgi:hypothetical protein
MLLTAANLDLKWQSVCIDNGVDFCRQPSTRTSKSFASAIFGATRVLMRADYCAVDHLNFSIFLMRDGGQDTIPDPSLAP